MAFASSLRKYALLLLISLLLAAQTALGYDFEPGEYEELRDLTFAIMMKYPPDQYFYVGIGRSPTPVTAIMQALNSDSARNVPFAGFREKPDGSAAVLVTDEMNRLRQTIMRFFPDEDVVGGRKVLLIDFSISGNSLVVAKTEFSAIFPEVLFEALAISTDPFSDDIKERAEGKIVEVFEMTNKRFPSTLAKFVTAKYKRYAEYASAKDMKNDVETKSDPAYLDLKKSFAEKLASDSTLARFLNKIKSIMCGAVATEEKPFEHRRLQRFQ